MQLQAYMIEYTQYIHDYAKAHGNYTKEKFEEDLARYEHEHSTGKGVINVLPAMSRVVDHLWESGTTKFLDKKGNVILYEKENALESVYDGNYNMKNYIEENRDAKYHLVDKNGTETFTEILRQPKAQETQTQTPATPKERTILTENNTTQAEDIIRADENKQSCSILPPDVMVPNAQIAAFDSNESTDENNQSQGGVIFPASSGIYKDAKDLEAIAKTNTQETQQKSSDNVKDIQKTLQDLYPHLYQDKSDEDKMDNQDDYGMEM